MTTDNFSTGTRSVPTFWALAGLSLCLLLASLSISIANVALPTLARAFAAPFQAVQWVVLAYLLATTALVVSAGRLGDMLGRRRLLLAGLLLFAVASGLCALAPTLPLLIAARAAQGVGAAILMALSLAIAAEIMPTGQTGRAMGLLGTMSAVGTALGPSLGGVLIEAFGWRAIFWLCLPLALLAFGLLVCRLPASPDRPAGQRSSFDLLGTALLTASLAAYALAMTVGRGQFGLNNGLLLLAAVAGGVLFMQVQKRAAAPLIRLALFRRPGLSAGFATSAVVSTVVMATLVVGPFYLAGPLGLTPAQVGLVLSCGPVVAALTGLPAGRLTDRFGANPILWTGLSAMLVGCAALVVVPVAFGVVGYIGPLVLTTAGYALFQAANTTAVMAGGPAEQRGVISGLLTLSRNLGLVTGASALGAVFVWGAGVGDLRAGMQASLSAACLLLVGAMALVGWRVKPGAGSNTKSG